MPSSIRTYATPSRLYRYRPMTAESLEQELDAVAKGYVFCAGYDEMNDPMEGSHSETALLKSATHYDRTIAQVTKAKSALGIASFSETHRSEPMWAYYAGSFRGICVAYDLRLLLREVDGGEFVRMAYSETPPVLARGKRTVDEMAKMSLSTKTVRWAPEREWRLFQDVRGPSAYKSIKAVRGVYLGFRMDEGPRSAVVKVMRQLDIPVWQMKIEQYDLEYRSYPPKLKLKRA